MTRCSNRCARSREIPTALVRCCARRNVYANCSLGVRAIYPCAEAKCIQPPRRRWTSSEIPSLRIRLEPPTRRACPVYSFDHATVMSGTQSSSADCRALTKVCSPIQFLGLTHCFRGEQYTREGNRLSLGEDCERRVLT